MISKSWGQFPTAAEIEKEGVWDGKFYWDLKGPDRVLADACGLGNEWYPTTLKELFSGVRKMVKAGDWSDRKILSELRKAGMADRYSIEDFRDEAMSLPSAVMQVACGVEWI